VSQPCNREHHRKLQTHVRNDLRACNQERKGVSQPWHAESVANALHCHLRTCVSASKNRFLAGKRSHCTKSGGRKPPWDVLGMRTRNAEIQCIAIADAVCKPTAGSRPPLLKTSDYSSQKPFPSSGCSLCRRQERGGVSPPWYRCTRCQR
jgi:hypothetical protein